MVTEPLIELHCLNMVHGETLYFQEATQNVALIFCMLMKMLTNNDTENSLFG